MHHRLYVSLLEAQTIWQRHYKTNMDPAGCPLTQASGGVSKFGLGPILRPRAEIAQKRCRKKSRKAQVYDS